MIRRLLHSRYITKRLPDRPDDFDKRCAFAQEPQCVLDLFVVLMSFDVDEEQVFPQRGFAWATFELGH